MNHMTDFPDIVSYLSEIPVEQWTAAFDGGRRFGIMTTNVAETVNGILKAIRHVPITAIVEETFARIVKYFNDYRDEYATDDAAGHIYPSKIRDLLERRARKSMYHDVVSFNKQTGICQVKTRYNVATSKGGNVQVVHLRQRTCSCGKFQGRRLPCSHVMASCRALQMNWTQYVGKWYTIDFCQRVYATDNFSVPHESYWPPYNGRPLQRNDNMRRASKGRPKSSRYKNEMDWRANPTQLRCSMCGQLGHNRRTCRNRVR